MPSHPSDSLALQRPSIFTMALINHQQTLKLGRETEDEPPTDTVPVKKQAFFFTAGMFIFPTDPLVKGPPADLALH